MPNHPKDLCVNCHFLSKKIPDAANNLERSVSEEDRGRLRKDVLSLTNTDKVWLGCHMEVWSADNPPDENKLTEEIFTTERKGYCFYWPYRPGMAFPAAQTLQKREADDIDAAHDRKLVIRSLQIAIAALVVQVILALIGFVISWCKS
jgi:hypothetical protein